MRTILAILIIGFILASCTKATNTTTVVTTSGTGTITANISGTNDTFKINTVDTLTTAYGFYERAVEGSLDTSSTANRIAIVAASYYPITAGAYNENGTTTDARIILQGNIGLYNNNSSVPNPVLITITSETSTSVHGTFQGNIFQTLNDSLVVTNGKFDFTK
jgi:hypothetical protein